MPHYAVLIYAVDSAHASGAGSSELKENDRHADELAKAGSLLLAYALTPREMATSIRATGITKGAFVDTQEFIAGFYLLEAPDIDTAVKIAGTNPAVRTTNGGVEVRPVHSGGIIEYEAK